jgi:hypothetical protein
MRVRPGDMVVITTAAALRDRRSSLPGQLRRTGAVTTDDLALVVAVDGPSALEVFVIARSGSGWLFGASLRKL